MCWYLRGCTLLTYLQISPLNLNTFTLAPNDPTHGPKWPRPGLKARVYRNNYHGLNFSTFYLIKVHQGEKTNCKIYIKNTTIECTCLLSPKSSGVRILLETRLFIILVASQLGQKVPEKLCTFSSLVEPNMCLFVIGSFNLRGKQCACVLGHWSVVEDSVGGLLCHHHHHGPAPPTLQRETGTHNCHQNYAHIWQSSNILWPLQFS